jgi:hypothetical protein
VIRLFSVEVALFLAPFVAYGLFIWGTREGLLHPEAWSVRKLIVLSLVAVVLTAGGFIAVAQRSGGPAHSTYVPAHVENGQLVPGTLK